MFKATNILVLGLLVAFFIPNISYASIFIDNYSGTNSDTGYVFGSNSGTREGLRMAQSFVNETDITWTVSGVASKIGKQGTPSDGFVVAIQADSSGDPSGTDLCSFTGTAASISADPGDRRDITFTSTCDLIGPATYWIVYRRETEANISSSNNYVVSAISTQLYGNGHPEVYNSPTWATMGAPGDRDYLFEVVGTVSGSGGSESATSTVSVFEGSFLIFSSLLTYFLTILFGLWIWTYLKRF